MAARRRPASADAATLERLVSAKEIVIHCGSGGVGKTTTAAAVAAEAAIHLGGKVLVLTVDPAKRLANALGIERFGNVETQVPTAAPLTAKMTVVAQRGVMPGSPRRRRRGRGRAVRRVRPPRRRGG